MAHVAIHDPDGEYIMAIAEILQEERKPGRLHLRMPHRDVWFNRQSQTGLWVVEGGRLGWEIRQVGPPLNTK